MDTYDNAKKSLKVACSIRGVEQKDVAKKLGYSKQHLGQLVSKRNSDNLKLVQLGAIANALDFKAWQFMRLADDDYMESNNGY